VRAMPADVEQQGQSPGAVAEPGLPVLPQGGMAYWLSGLLAVTAAVAGLLMFLVPGILHGTAVMNGSARGTALAVLLFGVPVLAVSMALAWAGSARAVLCWLGAAAFLLYNSVLFLFATPFNRLFLLDVAMLALAAWSVGALLWQTNVAGLGRRFSDRAPVRGVALYVWVIVVLNVLIWLSRIMPALASGGQAAFLRGTGLPTNPIYVQDLALWLPLIAVAAAWLWRRRAWGFLVTGGALVMWVLESAGIAVDQWYGHAADPASTVASAALSPAFAALAVIGLVPTYYLFRSLRGGAQGHLAGSSIPVAGHRSWPAWLLAGMFLLAGTAGVFGGISLARNGFGMPLSWLHQTPFTSWVLPGVALLIGVALPQFTAFGLIVSGHRWALAGSYLAGLGLVLWIAVQLLLLQRYFIMQPAIAAAGAMEMLLAWLWQRATAAPASPPARLARRHAH
jgi:MYXO-CTERM domain-containing protein